MNDECRCGFPRQELLAVLVGLPLWLTGCSAVPTYKSPEGGSDRAFLTLEYSGDKVITGGVVVHRYDGGLGCEDSKENREKVFMLSRGNPLISNVNLQGVSIPSGKKFTFYVLLVQDTTIVCKHNASFTPSTGVAYELRVAQQGVKVLVWDKVPECSIEVLEQRGENKDQKYPAADLQIESCR